MLASWFHPSGIQKKLQNVRHLQSTYSAFAAILEDGSVVTWGDSKAGGNSTGVRKRLKQLGCYGCRNVPQNTVLWVCVCVCVCVKTPRNKAIWFCRFFGSGGRSTMTSLLPTKVLVIRWWYWDWSSQRTCKFVMVKLCSFVRFPFFGQAVASNSHKTSTFRMNFRCSSDRFSTHGRCIHDQFSINFRCRGRLTFDSISTLFGLISDECPTQFRLFFDQLTLDELRRILDYNFTPMIDFNRTSFHVCVNRGLWDWLFLLRTTRDKHVDSHQCQSSGSYVIPVGWTFGEGPIQKP